MHKSSKFSKFKSFLDLEEPKYLEALGVALNLERKDDKNPFRTLFRQDNIFLKAIREAVTPNSPIDPALS